MREKEIETYLRNEVKKAGGKAYKFESPGNDGVPDRIVIFPGNNIYFVELKAPGKKPRPLQIKQMRDLKNFGCHVCVLDSKQLVDEFVKTGRSPVKVHWTPAFQSYGSAGDEAEPFCDNCESYLQVDFKFCPGCGSELDWGETQ